MSGFRIALVGYGAWGAVLARAIRRNPRLTLSDVVTSNSSAATDFPDALVHSRLDGLFAEGAPDAALVATGPERHVETCLEFLEKGCPCFVEKPVATSPPEMERLRVAAARFRRGVHVDYVHRHHPAYDALRAALPRIAPIREVRSMGGNAGPVRTGYSALWDYGPHDVAMILGIVGEAPDVVDCAVSRSTDATATYDIRYRAGAIEGRARVGNDFREKARRFAVIGDGGTLVYDDLAVDPLTLDGDPLPVPKIAVTPLDRALDRFADSLDAGGAESLFLEESVTITEFLATAERRAA